MDNRPIGVFDSGLGGLTTVAELRKILPNEDIVYFGDTGRVPYGTRSREIIEKYAMQDITFLRSMDVKFIISACGTVSSVLSDRTIKQYTGVIAPASIAALTATTNKRIGIIGTTATIKSGSFESTIAQLDPEVATIGVACPLFVPLVENGFSARNCEVTRLVAKQYLASLADYGIDTLILGCTHYPIIKDIIKDILGSKVTLINSGQEAARYAHQLLCEQASLNDGEKAGNCKFFVSDTVIEFQQNASVILHEPIDGNVTRIDIENY